MLAVVDGLKGFPDAITAVFPEAMVQTCIVHLLRNSMDFVAWKDRKTLGTALKAIYRAVDAAAAEEALTAFEASFWGQRYPAIGQSRSEEHTSELQSLMRISYAVISLKKKKNVPSHT